MALAGLAPWWSWPRFRFEFVAAKSGRRAISRPAATGAIAQATVARLLPPPVDVTATAAAIETVSAQLTAEAEQPDPSPQPQR